MSEIVAYAYSYITLPKSCDIQAYAITPDGRTVHAVVKGFRPSVYVEITSPPAVQVVPGSPLADMICAAIARKFPSTRWATRKRLRGNSYDPAIQGETLQPFLRVSAHSMGSLYMLPKMLQDGRLLGNAPEWPQVTGRVHELGMPPVLQYLTAHDLPTAGWVAINGSELKNGDTCSFVDSDGSCGIHMACPPAGIKPLSAERCADLGLPAMPPMRVFSFDIEAFSSVAGRMPQAAEAADEVFQISVALGTAGSKGQVEPARNWLLTLGKPDNTMFAAGTTVIACKNEGALIERFARLIVELQPHIVTGYNIFGFDFPYLCERARLTRTYEELLRVGFDCVQGEVRNVEWTSTAFRSQKFTYVTAPGRIMVDLHPMAQREFKLSNYRLATVAAHVLQGAAAKDPLEPAGIFAAYRMGVKNEQPCGLESLPPAERKAAQARLAAQVLSACGLYCIKDAQLVLDMFMALDVCASLLEMGSTTHIHAEAVYTKGQQAKVSALLYRQCVRQGRVFQAHAREETTAVADKFEGAYVFEPEPGLYANVVSFDFSSLYPTTIIRYNVCYSTLVPEDDTAFPDSLCHVVEVEEHVGCEHDPQQRKMPAKKHICRSHRCRFRKEPQGVLPGLLELLLSARKQTRAQLKTLKGTMAGTVLDKRQLAFKVAANSVYGALGVKNGPLSFFEGAASVTALGRQNIKRAAEWMRSEAHARLVYGDTDSVYVQFPEVQGNPMGDPAAAAALWDHCLAVERRINTELFTDPMRLVFEEAIHGKFLIMSKKRYVCKAVDRAGAVALALLIKGLMLTRRDNAKAMRAVYEAMIRYIFDCATTSSAELGQGLRAIICGFARNSMFGRGLPFDDFVVSKSVGDTSSYKIRPLSADPAAAAKRLKNLRCTEEEYGLHALPGVVQLAERMRRRGTPVPAGSRLEFVFVDMPLTAPEDKVQHRIEEAEFVRPRQHVLPLDIIHYLGLLESPADELLTVITGQPSTFVKQMHKERVRYWKVLGELKRLSRAHVSSGFLPPHVAMAGTAAPADAHLHIAV